MLVGQHGQTAYINQYFVVKNGATASKHIFTGNTRIVSIVQPGTKLI